MTRPVLSSGHLRHGKRNLQIKTEYEFNFSNLVARSRLLSGKPTSINSLFLYCLAAGRGKGSGNNTCLNLEIHTPTRPHRLI